MDITTEIKEEIKEENFDEEISITQYIPPITALGGDYPVVQIKEESQDLADLILEHIATSTTSDLIVTEATTAEPDNFLSVMDRPRPRREPRPKVFYDELYDEPSRKKANRSIDSDSDASLSLLSDESSPEPEPKKPKKSRGPGADSFSDRSLPSSSKPGKRFRKPGPFSKTLYLEPHDGEFQNYSTALKKIRQRERVLSAATKADETIPIPVDSDNSHSPTYTRRVPNDYYRAQFKIKPCYVAVHNIIKLLQTEPVRIIGINVGDCAICQKLRAFTTVDLRGPATLTRSKSSNTLELTLKPLPPSEIVSVRAYKNGKVRGYFVNKSGIAGFIKKVNEALNSTLSSQLHTTFKMLLPPDFNWKSLMPDCSPISPETQKRFMETLVDFSNEQDLSPMFADIPTAKTADNERKKEKLRCCMTCCQIFRYEATHICPGKVFPAAPTPTLPEALPPNTLALPGVTIKPVRGVKIQPPVKCLNCGVNIKTSVPHSCSTNTSAVRHCINCKVSFSGNSHKCANKKTPPKCPKCSLTLIAGGLHTCGKVVQAPEPSFPAPPMEMESPANSDNILEEVFSCMICSKSYKYEFSLKNHVCLPHENICKLCLKPCEKNDGHFCTGQAKCLKCSVIVKSDQYSSHLCKLLKYCSYCKKTVKGITPELECNIIECRVLKLCKVCDSSIVRGESHQCKNIISCNACGIMHSTKVKHKCANVAGEKCKSCSQVMVDKKTHKCPVFKTCDFCMKRYDENERHQCVANQCLQCKYIVPLDGIDAHKCSDITVCILCKTPVMKSKLDDHKCTPYSRCQICQFPMSSNTKHKCKTCPYCNAIFSKSHVCFSETSKNKSNSTLIKSAPKTPPIIENKSKHTYTCSTCSMTTKLKTEFLKHSCVKKVDEVFLCNGCPKMFSKREFLEKHQATMCPKKKCTPCTKCGISLMEDMVKTHKCAMKLLQVAQKGGVAQPVDKPKKVVTIATPKENLLQEQNQNVPPVKATVTINRGENVPEKIFSVNATVPASTKAIVKKSPIKSKPQSVKISAASTPKPLPKNVKENMSSGILEPPTISASDFEMLVTSVAGETTVDTSSIFSSPTKKDYLSLPSLDEDNLQFSDAIVEVNSTNDPLTWEEFRAEISYN